MKLEIGRKRSELVGGMYRYVSNIVTLAIEQNKKLIIWGCGKGGAFLTHLICDVDGRLPISYYIDEYMVLPCGIPDRIYRSSLLRYISEDEYMVLLSIRRDERTIVTLKNAGYIEGKTYFDVRSEIGGSYLEYLEKNNSEVDFSYVTKEDRPNLYSGEYFESKPFDHSSIDKVFNEISVLPCEKSFLDIGCGKGQILVMAAMAEMDRFSGVEFNSEIAEIAKNNMEKLQIDAEIIIADATDYEGLDNYSIFFLYNPFGEGSIKRVVSHIKESSIRKPRSVFLVYGNPFYHKAVMGIGSISLHKQVGVDLYDPILNIYSIGDYL